MSMMASIIDNPALLDNWIPHAPAMLKLEIRPDVPDMAEHRATIVKHLKAIDSLSSDRRIQYLAEHGFTDTAIRQLLSAIQRVISRDYGETIQQKATQHARQGGDLADVVADVSNTNIIYDLALVCYRDGDEHDVIAAAYANHELYCTINAALNVAKLVGEEQAEYGKTSNPQCVERDQLLAEAGLAEDARLWPEY